MGRVLLLLLITGCSSDVDKTSFGDLFGIAVKEHACLVSNPITETATYHDSFYTCPKSLFLELMDEANVELRLRYR